MERVASFEKVSIDQFSVDFIASFPSATEEEIIKAFNSVRLPQRATKGSAGYDIYLVCATRIFPGTSLSIPTGLRVKIKDGWVFLIVPKSSLGIKYRLQLDNTVGVIDSDYYQAQNEGHILIKITNDSKEDNVLTLDCGKGFAQGIFVPFGITQEDEATNLRLGGFGSTEV